MSVQHESCNSAQQQQSWSGIGGRDFEETYIFMTCLWWAQMHEGGVREREIEREREKTKKETERERGARERERERERERKSETLLREAQQE